MEWALRFEAPAKVNLLLTVGERDTAGYHRVETIMQAVDLCDLVEVRRTERGVDLACRGTDVGPDEKNLAYRAARAFLREVRPEGGVHVSLTKRVPSGAGLGGGSSDAAAVLRLANRLWGRPLDSSSLAELGAALGVDVSFFLGPGTRALGEDRGDRLTPLPPLPEASVVLVLPPVHVSTAEAYGWLDAARAHAGGGGSPGSARASVPEVPACWDAVAKAAENDFETVVPAAVPEVARALKELRETDPSLALLSGSGGACFAVYRAPARARAAFGRLRPKWPDGSVVLTRTLSTWPAVRRFAGT